MEKKVSDISKYGKNREQNGNLRNLRKFLLRCLGKNINPVSIRMKSKIKTPRGLNILKKAERALLNERIRIINNTLEMLECQSDTCMNKLSRVLDQEVMEESKVFMNKTKEARHFKTLDHQKAKFERLWLRNKGGHSNGDNLNMYRYMYHSSKNLDSRQTATTTTATSKWVINMSSTPLTEVQKQLLAHGSNFTISARSQPLGEYISAVEQTCQSLAQGGKELCAEVKAVIKKIQPPRPNITREEQKALKELREDNNRVVLTAHKGYVW